MTHISSLLKIQPDIVVNVDNIAYIELTGKGAWTFISSEESKRYNLNATDESLRNYISGEEVTDLSTAA